MFNAIFEMPSEQEEKGKDFKVNTLYICYMIKKVIGIVEEASKILMDFYDGDYEKNYKMKGEIVTTADIKVDEYLQKRLREEFPNDQILSEETENMVSNYSGRV